MRSKLFLALLSVFLALPVQAQGPWVSSGDCPPGRWGTQKAPGRVPQAEVPAAAVAASVRVDVRTGQSISCGSGTHLGYGVFLTNRHVGERAGYKATVMFPTGKLYQGSVQGVCGYSDMAVIVCADAAKEPGAKLAEAVPATGTAVYSAGYPASAGRMLSKKRGSMRSSARVEWGTSNLIGMNCSSGDSGSGIFNEQGELVGVLWGGDNGSTTCCTFADTKRYVTEECFRFFPRNQPPPQPIVQAPPAPSVPAPPYMPPADNSAAVLAMLQQMQQDINDLKARKPIPGPAGKDGQDGKPGVPGAQGLPGIQGESGKDGLNGKDGSPGKDGAVGAVGPRGADADPAALSDLQSRVKALEENLKTLSGSVRVPGTPDKPPK